MASSIPGMLNHYLGQTQDLACGGLGEELSDIDIDDMSSNSISLEDIKPIREDPILISILREAKQSINKDSKLEKLINQIENIKSI